MHEVSAAKINRKTLSGNAVYNVRVEHVQWAWLHIRGRGSLMKVVRPANLAL
jgi:hypothetical protein